MEGGELCIVYVVDIRHHLAFSGANSRYGNKVEETKPTSTTGFVTEPCCHFGIIMAPCARLPEVEYAPGSGLVA